jgi:TonB family protein
MFCCLVVSAQANSASEPEIIRPRFMVIKENESDAMRLGFSVAVQLISSRADNVEFQFPQELPLPRYPAELLHAGVVGEVILSCAVRRNGEIGEITTEKSDAPDFARNSIEALKKWRAVSIHGPGKADSFHVRVRFIFSVFSE